MATRKMATRKMAAAAEKSAPKEPAAKDAVNAEDLTPVDAPVFHVTTIQVADVGNDLILTFTAPHPALQKNGALARGVALSQVVCILKGSPGTMKDLSILLTGAMAAHEAKYGEVKTDYTIKRAAGDAKSQKTH
jgi:hypothetical protein